MLETIKTFTSLTEEFVECSMRHDPVAATAAGIHDYDDRLPDDTPDGFRERGAWLRDFEQRLVASVPWEELPVEQRVDFALLRSRIAVQRARLEEMRTHSRDPVRYPRTAMQGVFLLMSRPFAPLDERKEAILSRLMAIPDYLDAARTNLVEVPALHAAMAGDVNSTGPVFVEELVRELVRAFPAEAERIEHAGSRARMGFVQYQSFLEETLPRKVGGTFAIGERWMNFLLDREHLLSMDCNALEALGREQVASFAAALTREAKAIDPARSWREIVAEAKQRRPEPLRLRDAYVAEVERARRFVVEHRLAPVPEVPLEIVDTPVFDRTLTPAVSYLAPAPFDQDLIGTLHVTPIDLAWRREDQDQQLAAHHYAILPLVALHETWPGHHLQLSHAATSGSRLRRLGDNHVFAEGWALYCEQLMGDQGYFLDPVTRLCQLEDLLWRACRVVIDVGLHTGRMGVAEAVEMLVADAMLEPVLAEREVHRHTLEPGRAMSGLVGRQLMLELRDEARRRMGAAFDLHGFHAALLASGTIPPSLAVEELWGRLGAS